MMIEANSAPCGSAYRDAPSAVSPRLLGDDLPDDDGGRHGRGALERLNSGNIARPDQRPLSPGLLALARRLAVRSVPSQGAVVRLRACPVLITERPAVGVDDAPPPHNAH